jgi:hypothetical protein
MTEERLVPVLNDRGVVLGTDVGGGVGRWRRGVAVLTDERWVSLPALLAGRVFTRRSSALEIEHDFLESSLDLCPVDVLTEHAGYQRLVDGSPVVGVLPGLDDDALEARGVPPVAVDDLGALLLPIGYLVGEGLNEGDVIEVRVTEEGLLLEAAPDEVTSADGTAAVGHRLSRVPAAQSDEPVLLDEAVWTACADDATLFTELLPPLGEVLEACGLACAGEWLAPPGFDFRRCEGFSALPAT